MEKLKVLARFHQVISSCLGSSPHSVSVGKHTVGDGAERAENILAPM